MRYCSSTSECVLETATTIPSLIYIIYYVVLLVIKHNTSTDPVYTNINASRWNQEVIWFDKPAHLYYLIVTVFLLLLLIILIIAFACDNNASGSLVVSIVSQCAGWILLTVNVVRESWHIYLWPSKPIKIFLASYIVIYVIVTAAEQGNSDKMIKESLEQSSLFILTIMILLLILIKNYYYQDNIDDDVKITRYFSEDIESNSNRNSSFFGKIIELFKSNNKNENENVRSSFSHSVEKFYGRVFPSTFFTANDGISSKEYSEPLLVNANDPSDANSIISLQKDILSNSKEMSQTLMKHLESKNKSYLDVAPKNNKSSSNGNDRSVDDNDKFLIVSVIKWNFRKRNLSADSNGDSNKDDSGNSETDGEVILQNGKEASTESLNNDSNNSRTIITENEKRMKLAPKSPTHHSDEVEFEITLRLRNKIADSAEQQWYSQKEGESKKSQWSIWKTANDVFTFHLEIVNKFGDLAPRKPRLRTTLSGGLANRNDIISDTRTITTYLTAILRIDQATATLAFFDFLEVPSHLKALMTPNLFINLTPTSKGVSLIEDSGDNSAPPPLIVNKSNEQLFSVVESTVLNNKQDKYRKLFVAMRVSLKPKEITIRCRLFHGVITGADICKWLLRYSNGDDSLSNSVKDRIEANRIGQELLSCNLLSCVAYGFPDDYDDEELQSFNEELGMNKFSDLPSFIYKFPEKGSTNSLVGKFSLFGEALSISIPQWTRSEDNDGSARETQTYSIRQSEIINNISGGSLGHIEYLVVVSHLYDEWMSYKRFREFEQLKNALTREGIKIDVSLPTKSFGVFSTQIDSRKIDLETFLQSTTSAVIASCNERAMIVLAKFLDPNFDDLNLVQKSYNVLNTP